jgi:YD repeat-containing protein
VVSSRSADRLKIPIDPNGNLASKTEGTDNWTYTWNAENQLSKVEKNGAEVARFSYDAAGRRVETVAGGATTSYTYDDLDVLRESRGTSNLKYVTGPGNDELLAVDDELSPSYFHQDGLGSVLRLTDAGGAALLTRQYDAWGRPQLGASQGATPSRDESGSQRRRSTTTARGTTIRKQLGSPLRIRSGIELVSTTMHTSRMNRRDAAIHADSTGSRRQRRLPAP